jgi:hypothetical protein
VRASCGGGGAQAFSLLESLWVDTGTILGSAHQIGETERAAGSLRTLPIPRLLPNPVAFGRDSITLWL